MNTDYEVSVTLNGKKDESGSELYDVVAFRGNKFICLGEATKGEIHNLLEDAGLNDTVTQ